MTIDNQAVENASIDGDEALSFEEQLRSPLWKV
jgi:hypothetical protein